MTLASAFGYSLLIGVPCYLLGFVARGFWPVKVPAAPSPDPHSAPYGDVPYQEERL